ncbi:MAG: GNAT family protein [Dehalococcoidia bacterium]
MANEVSGLARPGREEVSKSNDLQDWQEGSCHVPEAISGRWAYLRPYRDSDFPYFYAWRTDLREYGLWKSKVAPTEEEYAAELATLRSRSVVLTVIDRVSSKPIGLAQAYDFSMEDGWTSCLGYIEPAFRVRGHGAEAGLLFADYLFSSFPIRKVYADVLEFNGSVLRTLQGIGFVVEGRRSEHGFFQGKYWDLFHLALTRTRWNDVRNRRFRNLVTLPFGFEQDGVDDTSWQPRS